MRTENGAAELLEAVKDEDAVVCVSRIFSGEHLICERGERYSVRNPAVRADPSAFVPVLRPGVDPATAVRCVAPIDQRNTRPNAPPWATERLCWPGELLDRADQLVLAHPAHFEEPR